MEAGAPLTLDYETIVHSDLGVLDDAAEAWKSMGDRYATLVGRYRDHVKAAVDADTWRGSAAMAYGSQARVTLEEFAGARDEARAVGKLLREAHATLQKHKERVESVRDRAKAAGITVSARGHCTVDLDRLRAKDVVKAERYAHNPLARQEAEHAWTSRIVRAVQDTQDADHNMKLALAAASSDGNRGLPDGFNGALPGDAGAANAARARTLYAALGRGEPLSPWEMRDLRFLARENAHDREYSRTLLNSLGPDGVIAAANRLSQLTHEGSPAHHAGSAALEKSLATTLATATSVPPFRDADGKRLPPGSKEYGARYRAWLKSDDGAFYRSWRKKTRVAGTKQFTACAGASPGGSGPRVRGYQSMVTLMQKGDGYSPQVLFDLADDIREAEEHEPDIWDRKHETSGRDLSWFANDPLDGTLGMMSENPAAATAYLDPKSDPDPLDGQHRNDRLADLVNDRDWKVVDASSWQGNVEVSQGDALDDDAYGGFGKLLKTATTGRLPDSDLGATPAAHSAANARVMHDVVEMFGKKPSLIQKDGAFEDLRPALGDMTADYSADVQRLMYRDDLPVSGASARFEAGALHGFLGAVARDPHAYGAIAAAQHAYTASHLHDVLKDLPPGSDRSDAAMDGQHAVRGGAKVLGILSEAKAAALFEDRVSEVQEFNEKADEASKWVNRFVSFGVETDVGGPVDGAAATPVGWLQEDLNTLVMQHIKKDVPGEASEGQKDAKYEFTQSGDQVVNAFQRMAQRVGGELKLNEGIAESVQTAVAGEAGVSFGIGAGAERAHGWVAPTG